MSDICNISMAYSVYYSYEKKHEFCSSYIGIFKFLSWKEF